MSHRIVIVGGGAGGIVLATRLGKRLGKHGKAQITLVDTQLTHIWKPLLHEIAAGTLNSYEDELNYFAHARKHHFQFQPGRLESLDRDAKEILLGEAIDQQGNVVLPARRVGYDTLIIAIGSVCNEFGTPGAKEHCIFLDSRRQAEHFHKELMSRYFRAHAERQQQAHQPLHIAIVGAGATGVELAAELHHTARTLVQYGLDAIRPDDVHITLVEAADRILPVLPERISASAHQELQHIGVKVLTGEKVTHITDTALHTASGKEIPGNLMVWSAGIKAPDFLAGIAGLETTRGNQLVVKPTLQTTRDPDIFALGDCSSLTLTGKDGKEIRIPPRAQSAYQQAVFLADSLASHLLKQRPLADFRYRDRGSLVSLAHTNTVGNLMGNLTGTVSVEGFVARMMYLALYRMHQVALHGVAMTGVLMLRDLLNRTAGARLKLH